MNVVDGVSKKAASPFQSPHIYITAFGATFVCAQ